VEDQGKDMEFPIREGKDEQVSCCSYGGNCASLPDAPEWLL